MASVGSSNRFALLSHDFPDTPCPQPRNSKKRFQKEKDKGKPQLDRVRIEYQVGLPDTTSTNLVDCHTPIPLLELSPVKQLKEDLSAEIEVSPARSACSEITIAVNTRWVSLLSKVKNELKEEYDMQVSQVYTRIMDLENKMAFASTALGANFQRTSDLEEWRTKQTKQTNDLDRWRMVGFDGTSWEEWNRRNSRKTEITSRITKAVCLRSIEDWCIKRMRVIMRLKPKELSHAALVDKFLASYLPVNFDVTYLLSLKDADDRDSLNDIIHISPNDDDDVNLIWDTLREGLSNEDAAKFKSLIEFGRSRTEVRFRG